MAQNEQKRINLLTKIESDSNTIKVSEVLQVFAGVTNLVINETKAAKNIKAHVTEDEFNAFLHSLINSFLTSLYVTASKNDKQREERMAEAKDTNSDLLIGIKTMK